MINNDSWFAIGTFGAKFPENTGTLWRSAQALGASYIFTIGERYVRRMSDTRRAWQSIPLLQFEDFESFQRSFPKGSSLVGVEICKKSKPLDTFVHPLRSVYLLGAEDIGLPEEIQRQCDSIVKIESSFCLNVSVTGSILAYDRQTKLSMGNFDRNPKIKNR